MGRGGTHTEIEMEKRRWAPERERERQRSTERGVGAHERDDVGGVAPLPLDPHPLPSKVSPKAAQVAQDRMPARVSPREVVGGGGGKGVHSYTRTR